MGGTFDPIHVGHLVAAEQAAFAAQLEDVVLVPAGQPQLKEHPPLANAEHRYAMVRAAVAGNSRLSVSRMELDRPGPTYTVQTLRELTARYPGDQWFFILGADAVTKLTQWKSVAELARMTSLLVVTRAGYEVALPPASAFPPEKIFIVTIPELEISSSECRRRVRQQEPLRYLVPGPVLQYVQTHQLYTEEPLKGTTP